MTYGADGWAWWDAETDAAMHDRLPATSPADKVGASDVFTAALTLALWQGHPIAAATLVAGTAARIAVSRRGGAERFPTMSELRDELSRSGGG